ncbi:MAG: hypothetical protein ACD_30C00109G0001 [uncultured bacterium]|uniref:Transcription elongation factor GreA/GreB C-terminal domain-containing protein n=3 Tax=Candidatus Daviesiibacteriota TaxID=1752718 RepID=A0A0G0ENQ2_9BACT|nr:MAG: hypothetical protein ACD_30C00109G0001 [uncultured bacterium]KKQ08593.1 MAG: hypothetical protein US19_C0021G0009 [Candidatus Daviesbacteria bacterium GW2011_GWB1_36_5]KKQ16272.1 MAG: hypothetical protein US28_C0003G0036 [Candidatus Daviesbacteria bacterium GW2011_GWA1_36_8]OGE33139.1 MAG: hypothetical protein A3C99_03885 [Candidatus Daviesbacteria bacterium RIFCSPHIGHO2_02_FULL_37_9]OGE36738.1 MAG: hypothetical protein A3E66_02285 [Candidatus Daviesbacteria bacterium RIFCSPHIGHO2_12_FU
MSPESKEKYLKELDLEIIRSEESLASSEEARNRSDSPMTSRYDTMREIYAQESNVKRDLLDAAKAFKIFIKDTTPNSEISEGAEFDAELWDADEKIKGAIFAPFSIKLPGVQVITSKSPLGEAVKGLSAGRVFTYRVGEKTMAGIINDVK